MNGSCMYFKFHFNICRPLCTTLINFYDTIPDLSQFLAMLSLLSLYDLISSSFLSSRFSSPTFLSDLLCPSSMGSWSPCLIRSVVSSRHIPESLKENASTYLKEISRRIQYARFPRAQSPIYAPTCPTSAGSTKIEKFCIIICPNNSNLLSFALFLSEFFKKWGDTGHIKIVVSCFSA